MGYYDEWKRLSEERDKKLDKLKSLKSALNSFKESSVKDVESKIKDILSKTEQEDNWQGKTKDSFVEAVKRLNDSEKDIYNTTDELVEKIDKKIAKIKREYSAKLNSCSADKWNDLDYAKAFIDGWGRNK